MKNSLTDEPELCFYAKTTRRRQNFEKVGVAILFQNLIQKLFCFNLFYCQISFRGTFGHFYVLRVKKVLSVRPSVRPCVNWLSACISFVFHSNCLKFFEHNHYVWGQIVLTFGATYPKGGTPSPRVTPNGYPLQNLPIEIFFNILNFFIFFPM